MVTEMLGLANAALGLWQSKEKRKYSDKLLKLDKEFRQALMARPIDHADIDNIQDEIKRFSVALARDMQK